MPNVLLLSKYPPLQGGTSAAAFFAVDEMVATGNTVSVVTNTCHATLANRMTVFPPARAAERCFASVQGPLPASGPGRLRVYQTSRLDDRAYIPWSRPDVSQLVGLAIRAARIAKPDIVIGWYLEPFGVAAAHAAHVLGLPYSLICAGSDVGRLARNRDLREVYAATFAGAHRVMVAGTLDERRRRALRIERSKCLPGAARPVMCRRPGNRPVPAHARLERLRESFRRNASGGYGDGALDEQIRAIEAVEPHPCHACPVVAIVGKVHPSKGHGRLVDALGALIDEGTKGFRLLMTLSGNETRIRDVLLRIRSRRSSDPEDLARRTLLMPIVHPVLMPDVLAQCDIVCCLDSGFGVEPHQPRLLREALASGCAVVCSTENAGKSGIDAHLVPGRNCETLEADDVATLARALRRVIVDTDHRRRLQVNARNLARILEGSVREINPLERLRSAYRDSLARGECS